MTNFDQSNNPYAPPVTLMADVAESDGLQDDLQDDLTRAFYAATYGTVFLPGLAYCVALFLLVKTYVRRAEFSPEHHRSFTITAVICLMLTPVVLAVAFGAIVLQVREGL